MNFHDHALSLFKENAVFFATVLHLAGIAVGVLLRKGHVSVKATEIIERQAAQMEILAGQLESQAGELGQAKAQVEAQAQREESIFSTIKIAEQSRDQWRDMYWRAGLGHSNLQAMLTRKIVQLNAKLKRLDARHDGEDPAMVQAVDKFRKEHVDPIPPDERRRIDADLRSNTVATRVSADVISRPE